MQTSVISSPQHSAASRCQATYRSNIRLTCPSHSALCKAAWVRQVAQDSSISVATQQLQPSKPRDLETADSRSKQQHHIQQFTHTQPQLQGQLARFTAKKHACQPVHELQRALAEYMALPASQYSVLDARKVERLDDTTFRCFVGRLAFLGFAVEPVITVSVVVEDRGCTIKLLSAQLQGSSAVQDINDRFTAQMTNIVRWQATSQPEIKEISSDTSIEVVVQVPAWFGFVPVSSIEATGSKVMSTTLNLMVPRFLEQLQKDYKQWASGDQSRKPVGEL